MYWTGTTGPDSQRGSVYDDTLDGRQGDDTLRGLDGNDVVFGGSGADVLVGGGGDDFIIGGVEADLIAGGAGNDSLAGGSGDTLDGGAGFDDFDFHATSSTAPEDIDLGVLSAGGTVTLADGGELRGLETGRLGFGSGNDRIETGDAGGFFVFAGAGDDTMSGGDGSDYLSGDAGSDLLNGGGGIDYVSYLAVGRGVKVSLGISGPQNTRGGGIDTLAGFENLDGSTFVDRLVGGSGANQIRGRGAANGVADQVGDTITGGGGNDTLDAGGLGTDGAWAVQLGGAGDDLIGSGDFINTFLGDGDNATLIGGKGQDTLYLELGATAVFESLKDSAKRQPDHVFLREAGLDNVIDLHLIDANSTEVGDQAFEIVQGEFSGEAGELRLFLTTGPDTLPETWVLMDVDGDARADALIVIEGDHQGFDGFVL